jgi:[CysO sulfur-carrier protein]-S-L-cysteine hydrolase
MKEAIAAIAAHARSTYPAECCGLLLLEADGTYRFVPIANVAGSEKGQETSSRGQRDGYVMDSKELLATLERAEQRGGSLYAIVHSHPDVGAYFSKEDRHMALGGGDEPLWPGVRYIVVSVRQGEVDGARLYTLNSAGHDFVEEQIEEITGYSRNR